MIYTQSGMLYDKIHDAPRLEFSIPPPPKSNKASHAGDGVIGTTSTKTAKATSKKARTVSNQDANDEFLASEVNAVSIYKGKETKQPGGKKKKQGKKKN